jgi:selenocysteine lyase/cysteine desulfurase
VSAIDVDAVRVETPGCSEIIHLNNAGAALPPGPVLSATIDYLEAESRLGGYQVALSRAEDLNRVYDAGAVLLGCQPDELAFTNSGTHAWTTALRAIALEPGDRVLASTAEYQANVYSLIQLRKRGIEVELIPDEPSGQVSLDALERMLARSAKPVKLVCATHIPTGGGIVNPVGEIGRLVNEAGARYLLDATQSVGQMALAVDEIGCDFLTVTGRKFLRGPRGTGLLYVRSGQDDLLDPEVLDGRSARWVGDWDYALSDGARRYETFEANMSAKVGLGVAIEYALRIGLDSISKRIKDLADALRALLGGLPLVRLAEHSGPQSGLVTFAVEGRSSDAVVTTLRAWGVNTSVVPTVPPAWDPFARIRTGLVRASVHYYNTDEELELAVAAL